MARMIPSQPHGTKNPTQKGRMEIKSITPRAEAGYSCPCVASGRGIPASSEKPPPVQTRGRMGGPPGC